MKIISRSSVLTSAMQDRGSECTPITQLKGRQRYCNRRRRLMKLCQIQNLPSAPSRTIWGPRNADVRRLPTKRASSTKWHSAIVCQLSFRIRRRRSLERRKEREIVDGLIAGQKRQWSGGERKEWLRELEMRTAASLSLSLRLTTDNRIGMRYK